MGIFIAVVFIAAVVLLVSRLRPGTPQDDVLGDHAPEPPPRLDVTTVPDGWVTLRDLNGSQAAVAQSMLEANGIRAALESSAPIGRATMAYPAGAGRFRLCVRPEDVEAAEGLLAEQ